LAKLQQVKPGAFFGTQCSLDIRHSWEHCFTALHGMQTRSSDENSVCPSVRLSVRHTRAL